MMQETAAAKPRVPLLHQNRNRIDHVAYLVSAANFQSTTERVAELLSLEFEGPYDLVERGLRICIDWSAGIEFIAPVNEALAKPQMEFLAEHGEGFYRLVFGVPDLEASLDRVRASGLETGLRVDARAIDPAWGERFERIDEVTIEAPAPGVFLTLGQIEPKPFALAKQAPPPAAGFVQNRNRIDHVAFLVRPENFDSVTRRVADLLGLTFEGPYHNRELGLRICIDWSAGIEFMAPIDPELAGAQIGYLDRYGEGFYRLVYGVPDLRAAAERTERMGLRTGIPLDGFTLDREWRERFERIEELTIERPVPGVRLAFGEIVPR